MSRKIYLSGSVDEESFKEFCEKMDEFEEIFSRQGRSTKMIVELVVNSIGGNALDAIAFLGRMRTSKITINVTVYGLCGSAAVMLLAAGKNRKMTKESWLYVHEDSASYKEHNTSQLEKQSKTARMFEDQWSTILEELTGTSKERWAALHKEDLYISAKDCVELGIVDEII